MLGQKMFLGLPMTIIYLLYLSGVGQSAPTRHYGHTGFSAPSVPTVPTRGRPRWRCPCSSQRTLSTCTLTPTAEPRRLFAIFAHRAGHVKHMLGALRNKYLMRTSGQADLEALRVGRVSIRGFPEIPSVTSHSFQEHSINITERVLHARTWLATAGLLLEQVRLNNNRGYGTDIQRLEDQGLYWMMCGLYKYLNNRHIVWTARIDTTIGQYEYSTIRNNGHHQGDHDLLDLLSLSKCAEMMEYLQQEFSYISQMEGN